MSPGGLPEHLDLMLTTSRPDGTLSQRKSPDYLSGDKGMASTREEIAKYIQEEFVNDGDAVDLETVDLLEEEIIDSLGIFTLVSFMEEKFGVSIDPTDINLDNFQNLDAIAALVDGNK